LSAVPGEPGPHASAVESLCQMQRVRARRGDRADKRTRFTSVPIGTTLAQIWTRLRPLYVRSAPCKRTEVHDYLETRSHPQPFQSCGSLRSTPSRDVLRGHNYLANPVRF